MGWGSELFSEPKVDEFHLLCERVDHNILRFEIPMHDPFGMQVLKCWTNLYHDAFYLILVEFAAVDVVVVSVVLTQVHLEVLKDEIDWFLSDYVIQKGSDVWMVALSQDLDLPWLDIMSGCVFKRNYLNSECFEWRLVDGLVDFAIGSFSYLFD